MGSTFVLRGLASAVAATLAVGTALYGRQVQRPQVIPAPQGTHTENGLAGYAKILCSGVFVSNRAPGDVARGSAYFFMPRAEQDQVKWTVDRDGKLARASLGGITREARYYGDQGCIIQNPEKPGIHFTPVPVRTTLPGTMSQDWPMGDRPGTARDEHRTRPRHLEAIGAGSLSGRNTPRQVLF